MLNQILAIQASLSKSEKQVAQRLLAAPDTFADLTIKDFALACGVSEPTIVRFCRTLNLKGYREFRLRLAQALSSQVHYQHQKIHATDNADLLIDKVFNGAIANLSKVRDQLKAGALELALSILANSKHIEIYGVGGSGIVVSDAQLKFVRLGLNSQAYSDIYLQRIAAGMLEADSCVLAISISGRSIDLIENIKLARSTNSRIISITASGSPLADLSDIHIAVDLDQDENELAPIRARFSHMAVVDTLAIGLAIRGKASQLARLQRADKLLKVKFE